jgi:hypothetical protein
VVEDGPVFTLTNVEDVKVLRIPFSAGGHTLLFF